MSRAIFHVDAFAGAPFEGNPAAVCILDAPADASWMQRVAAEMNLSETAFVVPGDDFDLRWFTPIREVALCGHATLAAAHVLFETRRVTRTAPIRFRTRSGTLRVECDATDPPWLHMDFPDCTPAAGDIPGDLVRAADVGDAIWTGTNARDAFVVAGSERHVRDARPVLDRIRRLVPGGALCITAAADPDAGYDYVSRFFAPAYGIDEDPVTGSAHAALGPLWAQRLGRPDLAGFQASSRGGLVRTRPVDDRVLISGTAVTTLRGELLA